MNYTLKLFRNVEFSPNDNAVVGKTADLEAYLSSRLVFATTTQNLVKLRPSLSIVVNIGDYSINYLKINYCEIIAPGNGVRNQWFYFVDSVEFVSNKAIRVNLSIDSLNTFYWTTTFYSDCHIVRRFKDRWMKTDKGYFPVYDKSSEGFEIAQTLNNSKIKTIKDYQDESAEAPIWLLAVEQTTADNKQSAGVRYYPILAPSQRIKVNARNRTDDTTYSDKTLSVSQGSIDDITTGNDFTETRKISEKTTKTLTIKGLRCYLLPYYPPAVGEATGTADNSVFAQPSGLFHGWLWNGTKNGASTLFFTDSLTTLANSKSVYDEQKTPYSRIVYSGDAFGINNDYPRQTPTAATKEERQAEMRNFSFDVSRLDPKLGTSEFTTLKFEYLGATFTFAPENQTGGTYSGVSVDYSISPNSDSPVRFKVNPLDWNGRNKYNYTDDDLGYLIPSADMSYPMVTSDYNQYRRFGNKYDKTANSLAYANIFASAGSAIGSSAVGFGVGGPVGAVVAGIGGALFSAITSAIGTWNNQQARLQSEKQKSRNISQSSIDFNIIQTKNRARFLTYEIPDYLKKSLTNYFHLFGYATDEYANPYTYNNTRYAYDFMKLDFVHYNKGSLEEAFREDFETKLKDGYYIYHVLVDYTPTAFDFEHKNGNMEVSLIEGRE